MLICANPSCDWVGKTKELAREGATLTCPKCGCAGFLEKDKLDKFHDEVFRPAMTKLANAVEEATFKAIGKNQREKPKKGD